MTKQTNWMSFSTGAMKPAALALTMAMCTGAAMAQMGGGAQQPAQGGASSNSPNSPNSMNAPGGMNGMQMNGGASMQDKSFLREASEGGLFEVQAGQLAAQKGNSQDVKDFGQMMVTDHTMLNDKMKPVAEKAGVQPAMKLKGKEKKEYDMLAGLNGDAFDQAYIKTMLKDHEDDQKAFRNEAQNGQLPEEKQAAMDGEQQVIDKHLDKIKQIAQAHNVSTGAM